MKLTLEIDQPEDKNKPPTVHILVDGEPLAFFERAEFEITVDKVRALVRFPDMKRFATKLSPAAGAAEVESIKAKIAQARKLLSFFRWVDVP